MLQRVQTLYLLITVVTSAALIFVFPLYQVSDNQGLWVYAASDNVLLGVFMCSAVLSLITILKYKNRKTQFMLGRLNIILNFFILGFFVYQSLNVSGETVVSKKGIGMLLPIISIVFLVLANKAIKRDEDLVKSVDRLR